MNRNIASPPSSPTDVVFRNRTIESLNLFCRRGLPDAEMHRLHSGHFAVEDFHHYIAQHMTAFYDRTAAS